MIAPRNAPSTTDSLLLKGFLLSMGSAFRKKRRGREKKLYTKNMCFVDDFVDN